VALNRDREFHCFQIPFVNLDKVLLDSRENDSELSAMGVIGRHSQPNKEVPRSRGYSVRMLSHSWHLAKYRSI
jgi:hypothetical protein